MSHHGGLEPLMTPFGAHMHVAEGERLKDLTTNDGPSHLEEQQVQASCGRNGWRDG